MPRLTASEMERLLNRNGIVHLAVVTDDGSPLVVPLGEGLRRFVVSEVSGWTMSDVRVVTT